MEHRMHIDKECDSPLICALCQKAGGLPEDALVVCLLLVVPFLHHEALPPRRPCSFPRLRLESASMCGLSWHVPALCHRGPHGACCTDAGSRDPGTAAWRGVGFAVHRAGKSRCGRVVTISDLLWGPAHAGWAAGRAMRREGWCAVDGGIDMVVGGRIAAARRRRGWHQHRLAEEIGRSESWVSQVERGVLTLDSVQTAEKIATALRLDVPYVLALDVRYRTEAPLQSTRAAVGLPGPVAPLRAPGRDAQDWLTVLRRMFVAGAGNVAAGAALGALAQFGTSRPGLDPGLLEDLSEIGVLYRRSYRAVPSESLLPLAVGQVRLAFSLEPADQPQPQRVALIRHAGQMAALAGVVQMLDLGDFTAADPLLRLAAQAAGAIGDAELTAVVYGCRAFHAGYSGDLPDGLDWAQAGQDAAARGASPRTRAWVAAVASEMHASLADADGCARALEQARNALARPAQDERWAGIGWLDEAKLDAYEGGDLSRLGRHGAAIERLTHALDTLDPSMARHRATALVDRADALAASGEAEAACRDAGEALETVARVHHAETLRRITKVALAVRAHRSPAARSLREHLIDVRASLPAGTAASKGAKL